MLLVAPLLLILALLPWRTHAMRRDRLARLRQETVDMFYHGYSNYMKHAFPEDELRPLTCAPLTRDQANPANIGLNDPLGNYSLTLIDSLSTLAILAGGPEDGSYTGPQALSDFQDGIAQFVEQYGDGRQGPSGQGLRASGFDLDSKVQVFETVIRGVGGLLSAHLFAVGDLPITGYKPKLVDEEPSDNPLELTPIPWPNGFKYDGQLLRLALDLGKRLLPAFYTDTGIPYPRVNLRYGIPFYTNSPLNRNRDGASNASDKKEITETCSAGAGSLTLEFTVLSRLTGDSRFERVAKRAFWEVWSRRSEIGLIGNGLDAERGSWIGPHAGIGAGMDSFFEYALKSHILLSGHGMPNDSMTQRFNDVNALDPTSLHPPLPVELHSAEAFLEAWHEAHASVKRYLYNDRHFYPYYSNIHRATGQPYTMWIDSLGAFYPGLLALAGELDEAIEANLVYTALWTRYGALPERWSVTLNNVEGGLGWWPGRPEFIESTYHIYCATKDPWYLYVGEMVLKDIQRRCYTPCGWAGLQDVRTGDKSDRMESFFLGETAKYLYLLFDPDHPLNKLDAAFVFTTEGHPLLIPKRARSKLKSKGPVAKSPKKDLVVYNYYNENFTNSCPVVRATDPFAASVTAARPSFFHAARFTGLLTTPNVHGPLEPLEVDGLVKYRTTTNHSFFPWTLPASMFPENGTSAAPTERIVSWIKFPVSDAANSLLARFGTSLMWYTPGGPTIKNLEGMELQFERQQQDEFGEQTWRITHVAGTALGRDETVFFYAEHVRHMKDESFACLRSQESVEIDLVTGGGDRKNTSVPIAADPPIESDTAFGEPMPSESLLQSLLRAVSSVFEPTFTDLPDSEPGTGSGPTTRNWQAFTATGPGAFPLPAVVDTPLLGYPTYNTRRPLANFPWKSIYMAGQACDEPLPDHAPREHQIIVMRRGGCSFSEKLQRIPSFANTPTSLQLVIVVDEGGTMPDEEDDEVIRPLLEDVQRTPKGVKRHNGIPLVLLRADKGSYELFRQAKAVGMRRKYIVISQGLLIENAVVL